MPYEAASLALRCQLQAAMSLTLISSRKRSQRCHMPLSRCTNTGPSSLSGSKDCQCHLQGTNFVSWTELEIKVSPCCCGLMTLPLRGTP